MNGDDITIGDLMIEEVRELIEIEKEKIKRLEESLAKKDIMLKKLTHIIWSEEKELEEHDKKITDLRELINSIL